MVNRDDNRNKSAATRLKSVANENDREFHEHEIISENQEK